MGNIQGITSVSPYGNYTTFLFLMQDL